MVRIIWLLGNSRQLEIEIEDICYMISGLQEIWARGDMESRE